MIQSIIYTIYYVGKNVNLTYLGEPIMQLLREYKEKDARKAVRKKAMTSNEIDETLVQKDQV